MLVLLRGRPSLDLDAGVFLSVAGRLLHGDHLYSGVWDNKDPLFFYVDAAALWAGGWKGPFLLDIVWVALAAAATVLLLRRLGCSAVAQATGFLAYPLLLTGQWYYAGYSMLAALAAAPVAGWLWARGNGALSGVVVGLAVLFKVNLALVLVAVPVALFLLCIPERRASAAGRFLAGLGGTLAVAAGVLAARGELGPYLRMLRDNVSYANDVLVANGRPGGIHGHLRVAENATHHARIVAAVFLLVAAVAVWQLTREKSSRAGLHRLAVTFLVVGSATALTLALTTAWNHHVQMLAFPGSLLVVIAVSGLGRVLPGPAPRLAVQIAAGLVGVWLLGGFQPAGSAGSISTWFHGAHSKTAAALEQVRGERVARAVDVSYVHLGQNDEEGHAAFIGKGWALSCAHFHEYPWTPASTLDSILRCVETSRPRLLLITSSLSDREGAPAAWHRFVVSARAFAQRGYTRVYFLRHTHGTVAVWMRR